MVLEVRAYASASASSPDPLFSSLSLPSLTHLLIHSLSINQSITHPLLFVRLRLDDPVAMGRIGEGKGWKKGKGRYEQARSNQPSMSKNRRKTPKTLRILVDKGGRQLVGGRGFFHFDGASF